MSLEIVFSTEAKETFSAIILFIRDQWGIKSAEKFVEKTYNRIDLMSTNPYIYRALGEDPSVRIAFITPRFLLFTKFIQSIFIFYIFGITGSNLSPK